jgi:two-component system, OmpR family, phosphate regulon response regulator PhoB
VNIKRILIVDDEESIRDMLRLALEMAGYECLEAETATTAHALVIDQCPDLVLLDWMLPGTSGIELARRLRKNVLTVKLPIIMLTARGEEKHKLLGLNAGADDYITKPFSMRELLARLKAVLRRTSIDSQQELINVYDLVLNPVSHCITAKGTELEVGPTEYRMLNFFMTHQDQAFTRSQLLDHIWGGSVYIEERTVDVHIRRLRRTVGSAYAPFIQTVRGVGYRFSAIARSDL